MSFIGAGVRALFRAITDGDPLAPAVTIFLVSIAITVIIAALRYARR
ncbi:hypothetical protein ACIBCA_08880 [Kitasatospora sp. NPDC051170]